jgi:transcriptional regulator with XRE-family HTH domain
MIDEDFLYKYIGKKIKHIRDNANLTQEELAKAINVSRASIANYESGNQSIYISDLYKIAAHLNMEIIDFLPHPKEVEARSHPERLLQEAKDLRVPEKKEIKEFIEKAK